MDELKPVRKFKYLDEKKVLKFGNGGHIIVSKEFINKNVVLYIEDENGTSLNI